MKAKDSRLLDFLRASDMEFEVDAQGDIAFVMAPIGQAFEWQTEDADAS